jgi:hypothetical protein
MGEGKTKKKRKNFVHSSFSFERNCLFKPNAVLVIRERGRYTRKTEKSKTPTNKQHQTKMERKKKRKKKDNDNPRMESEHASNGLQYR